MISHSPSFASGTGRRVAGFALAAAAVALGAALTSQYGFGLHPCELCLAQRVPYAAILLLAVALWRWPPLRWIGAAIVALFVVDAGIAGYHVAVEQGWIAGPAACAADAAPAGGLEALRAQIMAHQIVACSDVAFRFLGLSMAGWNAAYALACAVVTAVFLRTDRGGSHVAAG